MTAENCMYWQGEGCVIEAETGVRCQFQTKDIVSQCNATDEDLVEED